MAAAKFLWAISTPAHAVLAHALAMGATTVCIRSSNETLVNAIDEFHENGINVYAWRWPAVVEQPHSSSHYYALDEAKFVVDKLIGKLDGYIVDPESDSDGAVNDWNHASLAPLAQKFCDIIKTGAKNAGRDFRFGVTSGCAYPSHAGKPNIPWATFAAASDALYPQCYWRWTNPSTGSPQNINGGTPLAAMKSGISAWQSIPGGKQIIPMAGELDVITANEISAYATGALDVGNELHFYADSGAVPQQNIDMIKSL